jgi:tRNA (adenine22-N1)-methyltransferase
MKSKLSKRLTTLLDMIDSPRDFYDMCCDHGKLGLAAAQRGIERVHFVDPVKSIIEDLKQVSEEQNLSFYVARAQEIRPTNDSTVSIAGVGVNLGIDILDNLSSVSTNIDYILNLNGDHFVLRKYLASNNFSLLDEKLVYENKQFYEILKIKKSQEGTSVDFDKSRLWKEGSLACLYKEHLLSYLSIKLEYSDDKYLKSCQKNLFDQKN